MYLVIIEIIAFLAFMILPFIGPRKKKKKLVVKRNMLNRTASYAVNKNGYLERAAINR
jgi:hypothetical protein